ncbi:hypothetical protein BX666DRAFT_2028187 [Dichotomocladium elegans]|nr:hypothetical protein BX666DRAFT_2028187 [Dichotomocladium elegans]
MFQNGGGIKQTIRPSIKPLPPAIATNKNIIRSPLGQNTVPKTEAATGATITTIDKHSRDHLYTLLHLWLNSAKLPLSLLDTLIPIFLALVRSWPDVENVSVVETPPPSPASTIFDTVYIQTFGIKSSSDSRFLPGVHHGDPLSKVTRGLGSSQCDWLRHVIGGTIRIYNAPSGPSGDALVQIICAAVYTLWNLWLESHLLFDFRVRLSQEPATAAPSTSPSPETPHPAQPPTRMGFIRWLFGSSKENNSSGSVAVSPAVTEKSKRIIRKSTSFLRSSSNASFTSPGSTLATCLLDYNDPNRFSKIRKYLESSHVSSSPFCHYTAPRLLVRLQDEEDGLNTIRDVIQHSENVGAGTQAAARSKSFVKRTSSVLSIRSHGTTLRVLDLPQSIAAYSPLRVPGKMCDNKLGLDQLFLETNSVESFIEHQRLTFSYTRYPIGCPQHPCAGPVLSTVSFYDFDANSSCFDQPLGLAVQRWCDQAGMSCKMLQKQNMEKMFQPDHTSPMSIDSAASSSPTASHLLHSCDQPFMDHVMAFSHGNGRVHVYLNTEGPENPERIESKSNGSIQYKLIDVWTACSQCDAATKPIVLSVSSFHYSLGKFFELMLYHSHFTPDLCGHVSDKRTHAMRCFRPRGSNVTVKMAYEPVPLYELRAPRLQVMPDKQELRSSAVENKRPPISERTLTRWRKLVSDEVDAFFESIATHLDVLSHYVKAELKREIRQVKESDSEQQKALETELLVVQSELAGMRKVFWETEHLRLRQELEQTPLERMNDFRRVFALRATAIISQLTEWQENKCKDLFDGCGWEPPDYIKDKTVHPFPGSSVLVREEEPSSIIAYTLSSSEYLDELRQNKPQGYTGASQPIPAKSNPDADHVVDRYNSIITRKYVAPNTGAASETASFRTMILETVKTNAEELHYQQQRRIQGIKERLANGLFKNTSTPSAQGPQEEKTQRILMNEPEIQGDHGITTEVKTSMYEKKATTQEGANPELSSHIKHKFTHNDMEFTCIVYYACEFETLRRQCGIDQLMIQSLTRCTTWKASGGKSKSHFYKSQDDRLVIKEMVNAWNNIEKESILKFAPKYFDHMRKTSEESTWHYTNGRDMEILTSVSKISDKSVLLDLDVLVMEHLFYGAKPQITQRFDFKGIHDRHAENKSEKDTTLWDGDWIEGNQHEGASQLSLENSNDPQGFRLMYPVDEQSKALIQKAIQNDASFLASRNIMDYSLLLGIDDQKKELTVGIVGAYTWYKKMESRSKSTLRPNKEVTVVPPEQYRWRFCRLVDDYFISIPGKFDRIEAPRAASTSVFL